MDPNQPPSPEEIAAILAVAGIGLLVIIAIQVVLCLLVTSCFNRIPPEHRKQQPGLVWLLLIPCFPLIWNFFVYPKLAESFQSYFASVGRTDVGDAGHGIALAYCICAACSVIPCVNYVTSPASLVLVIIFLVKAHQLKNQIPAAAI